MTNTTTRWWWIRHAPVPESTSGGRIYGALDMPADTTDAATFAGLARRLLPKGAVLATSHLQRTHQTAAAIQAAGLGLPEPIVEADLAEQHLGDWQGRHADAVREELGEQHPFWLAPAHTRAPNGESFIDVVARVAAVIDPADRATAWPRRRRRRSRRHDPRRDRPHPGPRTRNGACVSHRQLRRHPPRPPRQRDRRHLVPQPRQLHDRRRVKLLLGKRAGMRAGCRANVAPASRQGSPVPPPSRQARPAKTGAAPASVTARV